jgi:DNA primase
MAAQRERLVAALGLDATQQARLDAIGAEMRPGFAGLRDLPEADRAAQRARLMAEMQQKISAMLTPAQRSSYEQLLAQAAGRAAAGQAGQAGAPVPAANPAPKTAAAPVGSGNVTGPGAGAAAANAPSAAPSGPVAAPLAGGGAGGGGPLLEFRNRLVAEVRLSPEQAAKVDALIAGVRPRYMALRDLSPEERPKARDRITADLRASIGDVLTAEQKPKYAAMLSEAAARTNTRGRIYLMGADGKPRAINVRLGITDGSSTELLVAPGGPNAADLQEGTLVIIGVQSPTAAGGARPPAGPRMTF